MIFFLGSFVLGLLLFSICVDWVCLDYGGWVGKSLCALAVLGFGRKGHVIGVDLTAMFELQFVSYSHDDIVNTKHFSTQ